jgi:hypothetical protein
MLGPRDYLLGILLPAVLCGVCLLVGRRLVFGAGRALAGVGFGAGCLLGQIGLLGFPHLPSSGLKPSVQDWLAWTLLAATFFSALHVLDRSHRVLALLSRIALVAALSFLTLDSWTSGALAFAVLFAVTTAVEAQARQVSGATMPLALLCSAVGVSLASLFAQNALFAQLAGVAAACLGASVVVAWIDRKFRLPAAGAQVAMLVLGACLLSGTFYGELPRSSLVLLLASLIAPALSESPVLGGAKSVKRVLFAAIPAAVAVALAYRPASDGY